MWRDSYTSRQIQKCIQNRNSWLQKLLHDNITKTYKRSDQRKINNINKDAKKDGGSFRHWIQNWKNARKLKLYYCKRPQIRLSTQISCCLINPSKSDIGKISKHALDKVNQKLISVTEVQPVKKFLLSYRMV